jgi:hypothetical protein
MWSHYANFHKGICIEYDLSKLKTSGNYFWNYFMMLYPVIYQEDRPILDLEEITKRLLRYKFENKDHDISNDIIISENIIKHYITKSIEWKDEKEYRFIFAEYLGIKSVPMNCISAIYFGCNFDKNSQKYIDYLEIAKQKHIKVFQVKLSDTKYELINELIYDGQ